MWVQCDQSSIWCVRHWMSSLSQSNTHVGTMWPVLNLVCWTLNDFSLSVKCTCGYNVTSPQSGVLDMEWLLSLSQIHMWVHVPSPQSGVLDIEWVLSLSQIHMWVQCDQSSIWCVGHWMTSLSQSNTHVGTMWPVLNLVCWTLNDFSLSVKYTCGYNVTSPQSGVLDMEWLLSLSVKYTCGYNVTSP